MAQASKPTSSSSGAMTSASGTSPAITRPAGRRTPTSTASPRRERSSPTATAAELHGRPGRVHHRPAPVPHRAAEGRAARRRTRAASRGPEHRGPAEEPRLRDRAVRQEPPRRSQRAPADGARLRRVLRQPLPPQRRGGAGGPAVSEGPAVQAALRPAWRAALQGQRQGRPDGRPALRPGRQADDRGHGPGHAQAHGDGGRGIPRRLARLHGARGQGRQAVLHLAQLDPDARMDAPGPEVRGQHGLRPVCRRHAATRRHGRRAARQARRTRRRRRHHRRFLDRQRPREVHLAGRWRVAVPRREGRYLGRRHGAFRAWSAGRASSSPARSSTASSRTRTGR